MSSAPFASRRLHAERLALLGWSRAVLLQLAHPLVAAGVAGHSSFDRGGLAAVSRLHGTVRAMLDLTYGDQERHAQAIAGIRAIHDRVHGTLKTAVGPFPAGTRYSAHDPALLLWVHATLLESIVLAYDTFIAPVDRHWRDEYCAESATAAIELGVIPTDVPRDWDSLLAYLLSVERSGVLVVSEDARRLARAVLSPPMHRAVWPAAWLNRQFTIGALPPAIRDQYGFRWSDASATRLRRATRVVHGLRRVLPSGLMTWRAARRRAPK